MPVLIPTTLDEALHALADRPHATVLAGGTDLMVEINSGHRRVGDVVAIDRVPELRSWRLSDDGTTIVIGAGCTYRALMQPELAALVPALAEASRTVGSPQIRQTGTLGGNLGTCSPAGDGLPVLAALDASIVVRSISGRRSMPVTEFMVGVKRTALQPGELVTEIQLPVLDGWQGYAKVGVRNAMVIATASACLAVDRPTRSIRLALGSVGPTILRCDDAEAFAAARVDWSTGSLDEDAVRRFGDIAQETSRPIDDHRSTAAYRRHAIGVLARRLLRRAFP
ncbi:MAG: xanthine dehydrogenase family protein subunit M [Acidimicrobiia bacterium]